MNIREFFTGRKIEKRDNNPLNIEIKETGVVTYTVDSLDALEVNAIHSCVNIIASAIAKLPLALYKRNNDGTRTKATGHRLYNISNNPNPDMTSMSFFYALLSNLLLYGNAYMQKIETDEGLKLNLIPSRYVTKININKNGTISYTISMNNDDAKLSGVFTKKDIVHIVGESIDGIHGKSPISLLHNTVEFAKILELYGKKYFENGANLTGTINAPLGKLFTPDTVDKLKKAINSNYAGINNMGKFMVLEDGLTYNPIQGNNDSTQFLQTKDSMIAEIARIFNVPLHLLQETTKSTSWGSGIEQMGIDFVKYTLDPHLKRIEQAFNTLLDYKDRGRYYFEFNIDEMLRSDQEARYRAYEIGLRCGFISPNEIRQKENMSPIKGGNLYFAQLNQPPYTGEDMNSYNNNIQKSKEVDNGNTIQSKQE